MAVDGISGGSGTSSPAEASDAAFETLQERMKDSIRSTLLNMLAIRAMSEGCSVEELLAANPDAQSALTNGTAFVGSLRAPTRIVEEQREDCRRLFAKYAGVGDAATLQEYARTQGAESVTSLLSGALQNPTGIRV